MNDETVPPQGGERLCFLLRAGSRGRSGRPVHHQLHLQGRSWRARRLPAVQSSAVDKQLHLGGRPPALLSELLSIHSARHRPPNLDAHALWLARLGADPSTFTSADISPNPCTVEFSHDGAPLRTDRTTDDNVNNS